MTKGLSMGDERGRATGGAEGTGCGALVWHQRSPRSAIGALGWLLCMPLAMVAQAADEQVGEMLDLQSQTTEQGQIIQDRVDQLADEAQQLLSDYRLRLQELDRVRRYNANLERTISDQEREKSSLNSQIEDFGDLEQGIVPLMMDMIDDLAEFVDLDVPFLLPERRARIGRLREVMDRSDVSVSEKYRQIMNAYMVETAFGRTIEAYSGQIDTGDGVLRKVEFFRLGRAALVYQTPDREIAGFWDAGAAEWRPLPATFGPSVNLGLRIAKKQAAPEILTLPVAAPSRAEPWAP